MCLPLGGKEAEYKILGFNVITGHLEHFRCKLLFTNVFCGCNIKGMKINWNLLNYYHLCGPITSDLYDSGNAHCLKSVLLLSSKCVSDKFSYKIIFYYVSYFQKHYIIYKHLCICRGIGNEHKPRHDILKITLLQM